MFGSVVLEIAYGISVHGVFFQYLSVIRALHRSIILCDHIPYAFILSFINITPYVVQRLSIIYVTNIICVGMPRLAAVSFRDTVASFLKNAQPYSTHPPKFRAILHEIATNVSRNDFRCVLQVIWVILDALRLPPPNSNICVTLPCWFMLNKLMNRDIDCHFTHFQLYF